MSSNKEIKELLENVSPEIRTLINGVIDLEYSRLHLKKATGVREQVEKIVREVIK
ncbi:MAG: hypothetical protein ACOX2P_03635 [Bacillota bacterium]